jgi:tetratricopeptide (TPR) repeat protein
MANPAWCTRSIDALQTASRLHPRAAEPWAHMGEVYFRKGFKANAAACFQRALELDPSVPIPPDVDLQALGSANASPMGESLFTRFKSILGRPEKP